MAYNVLEIVYVNVLFFFHSRFLSTGKESGEKLTGSYGDEAKSL